jgi:hypothetical protein
VLLSQASLLSIDEKQAVDKEKKPPSEAEAKAGIRCLLLLPRFSRQLPELLVVVVNAVRIDAPSGEPSPVQASQPGPAE